MFQTEQRLWAYEPLHPREGVEYIAGIKAQRRDIGQCRAAPVILALARKWQSSLQLQAPSLLHEEQAKRERWLVRHRFVAAT